MADARRLRRRQRGFSLGRLHWYECIGFVGAIVLAGSLFLPWFETDCASRRRRARRRRLQPELGLRRRARLFTAFETFTILDWLLLAACIAPFVLAYIIARGHALSWAPGEVTMIVGMVAFALIVLNGLILGKPGDTVDLALRIGYFVGLLGAVLIMVGGLLRQALVARVRKPPASCKGCASL